MTAESHLNFTEGGKEGDVPELKFDFLKNCLYLPVAPKDSDDPKGPNNRSEWPGPTVKTWGADGSGCFTYEEKEESDWSRWAIVEWDGPERLLIIDADLYKMGEKRKEEVFEAIRDLNARVHRSQRGGAHVFLLVDPKDLTEGGGLPISLSDHIDDKLNGYVLSPDCEGYEVMTDVMPRKIKPEDISEPIREPRKKETSVRSQTEVKIPTELKDDLPCWERISEGEIKSGRRRYACMVLAGHLRDEGIPKGVTISYMKDYHSRLPQPPEADSERPWSDVKRIVDDMYDEEKGYRVGCETVNRYFPDFCDPDNCPLENPEVERGEVKIADLSAELVNKPVRAEGLVAGEGKKKAIPKKVRITCSKCGAEDELTLHPQKDFSALRSVIFLSERKGENAIKAMADIPPKCNDDKSHNLSVRYDEYQDYVTLFCRDLLENVEKFDQREYKTEEVHLIGDVPPKSRRVRIEGVVGTHPKSKNLLFFVNGIEPLESEVHNFQVTEEDRESFTKFYAGSPEPHEEIAPHIVGRDLAKKWYSLVLHSPAEIPDPNGEVIPGYLRVAFFGGTGGGKSRTAEDFTDWGNFPHSVGEYCTVETGKRTGLLFTVDPDRKIIIWGRMVLNDLGFVVVDGLGDMPTEELAQFREAMRSGRVKVAMSEQGEALARTKVIACFNPDNPLSHYRYPCQGAMDCRAFSRGPDVARFDIFVPFDPADVPKHDISMERNMERPIPPKVSYRHILWAWSRRPDQVEYEPEALEILREEAARVVEKYEVRELPIVSNETFNSIYRACVAKAAEQHSTDDSHEKIIVRKEHVEDAIGLFEETYRKLGLDEYKMELEEELEISESEHEEIVEDLGGLDFDILRKVAVQTKSARVLAGELDKSEKTIKRHYKRLGKHGLIKTVRGKGTTTSPRGVKFLKIFAEKIREMEAEEVQKALENWRKASDQEGGGDKGTKNVPKSKDKEKGTQNVPMSPRGNEDNPEEKETEERERGGFGGGR